MSVEWDRDYKVRLHTCTCDSPRIVPMRGANVCANCFQYELPKWQFIGVPEPEEKNPSRLERILVNLACFGLTVGFWWGLIALGLWAAER